MEARRLRGFRRLCADETDAVPAGYGSEPRREHIDDFRLRHSYSLLPHLLHLHFYRVHDGRQRVKRGTADDRGLDTGLPGRRAARLGHAADATVPHYVRQELQKAQRSFHALQGAASLMDDGRHLVMNYSPTITAK